MKKQILELKLGEEVGGGDQVWVLQVGWLFSLSLSFSYLRQTLRTDLPGLEVAVL